MKKYLHLGYPKNFSTSLQRNYFSRHPEIYHLGTGIDSNVGYRDDLTSALFEVYLKTAKGFKYAQQATLLKKHVQSHYESAIKQGTACFGASSEHLSFGFTYESIEFETKIDRLIDLFGLDDLHFIMVIRNQKSLIQSLFRESIRVGLPMSYDEYIANLYKFQDRNYLYDFRYDLVYEALLTRVPASSVHFLINEQLRNEQGRMVKKDGRIELIDRLSSLLGVQYLDIEFEHFNQALTDAELKAKVELNKGSRHDLGREMLFSAEIHRQYRYFKDELGIDEPEDIVYEDVRTKRALIDKARELGAENQESLDYNCDRTIASWLSDFFKMGNVRFSELSGRVLPESYHTLDF